MMWLPAETGYTYEEQSFSGGGGRPFDNVIAATAPAGRYMYVLFTAVGPRVVFERYRDPLR